ncbi:7S RNA binding protein [Aureococcus anophagefferens]|nr:7S RNA binding protein [Aureococcus anophagefferens]
MAQDDAEALSKARDGLEKACRAEAYNKIIKKADEVLKLAPLDGDAIQAKAVALAKKDKCAEALAAAKDGGEALQGLRAYCHYRLGDLDDALECCRSMGEKDEGTCHVEAQVLYKQGDYAGAAGIYEGLLGDGRERGDADRRELEANYYAACCLAKEGARALNTLEPPAQPEEHYELAYNRGCCEAAAGAHATAKASLTAAHAGATKGKGAKKKAGKKKKDDDDGVDVVAVVQASMAKLSATGVDCARLAVVLAQVLAQKEQYAEAARALADSSVGSTLDGCLARADYLEKGGLLDEAKAALDDATIAGADNAFAVAATRLRLRDVAGAKAALAAVPEEGNEARLCPGREAKDVDAQALLDAPAPRSSRPRDRDLKFAPTQLSPEEIEAAAELRRQAALKRRAKKRVAYLAKLEAAGKYDPKNPPTPDPERWIPKKQRSYNRRGRKNKGKFVGAQGGDSNAKDVAKLDAAERARAKREADEKKAEQDAADAAAGLNNRKKGRQPASARRPPPRADRLPAPQRGRTSRLSAMGRGGCNAFDNFMAQQGAYHHEQEEERRAKAKAKRDAERRYEVALRGRGGFPATVTLYESSTLAELADEARRALFPDVAGGEVFFVDAAAGRPIYRDGAVLVASLAREPLTFDARVVAAPRWRVERRAEAADPDAILLCYEDHDAAAAYDGDGPVYRPCRAAGKGDRLHCYVSIGGEPVLFPYARLVHDAAGVRNVRVSSVLTNVRKGLARLAREAVLGTTRRGRRASASPGTSRRGTGPSRPSRRRSSPPRPGRRRRPPVRGARRRRRRGDAAAALLQRGRGLPAARELAALRRDQLGLREAQAAQADRFLAHHDKARFAGAVRFAATLERDADGPVVDRIVGFL